MISRLQGVHLSSIFTFCLIKRTCHKSTHSCVRSRTHFEICLQVWGNLVPLGLIWGAIYCRKHLIFLRGSPLRGGSHFILHDEEDLCLEVAISYKTHCPDTIYMGLGLDYSGSNHNQVDLFNLAI